MNAITRMLTLKTADLPIDIRIRLFWPTEDDKAWVCRWQIDWPDRQRTNSGRGVDAMQALVHALQMIGVEIYNSPEHRSGNLVWSDDWAGYGFPVMNTLRDLLKADDARYL